MSAQDTVSGSGMMIATAPSRGPGAQWRSCSMTARLSTCHWGHPRKIYKRSVHPGQNAHLRGFYPLNDISGQGGWNGFPSDIAPDGASPPVLRTIAYRHSGEGSGGGVTLSRQRGFGTISMNTWCGTGSSTSHLISLISGTSFSCRWMPGNMAARICILPFHCVDDLHSRLPADALSECVRGRIRWGGYQVWSWITTYGMRWKAEGVFSSIKRIFGEGVRATSRAGMFREVRMKTPTICRWRWWS